MKIAGDYDVGIKFSMESNKIPKHLRGTQFEIIEFRKKARTCPFVLKDLKTGEICTGEMSDFMIEQIRNGIITEIK